MLRFGVVENRNDPMKLGRCQVRVIGLHTPDKLELPTQELPWAIMMQPTTSAAMSGIGWAPVGPVPGTWVIVMFQDSDMQQPVIMGTVGGIPDAVPVTMMADDDTITIKDVNGVATRQVIKTSNGAITSSATESAESTEFITSGGTDESDPKTVPPTGTLSPAEAESNIKLILAACKAEGINNKLAKATILSIIGAESQWIPTSENLTFKNSGEAMSRFPSISSDEAKTYVDNPTFVANSIYGPGTTLGKMIGNSNENDGAKFIARGMIPIKGRAIHLTLDSALGIKFVDGIYAGGISELPDQLISNRQLSAKYAVKYIVYMMQKGIPHNDLRFFYSACKSIKSNAIDVDAKRKMYFEYFMGQRLRGSSKNALAYDNESTVTGNGIVVQPGGDRSSNYGSVGFTDPDGKYPLRELLNEADTNRLARGKTEGTVVELKDNSRTINIPITGGSTYSQPVVPYSSEYPYNHMYESESGHLFEMDDTPGGERIQMYHKSGTFTEVDANGTQVNKIVGDGYQIIERNGSIYIQGSANVTVDGNINILCNSHANIEVMGDTNLDLRGDMNMKVANDVKISAGGNFGIKVKGKFEVEAETSANVYGKTEVSLMSPGTTNIYGSALNMRVALKSPTITDALYTTTGQIKGSVLPFLDSPERKSTVEEPLETQEEFAADKKTAAKINKSIIGEKSTPQNTPSESCVVAKPNSVKHIASTEKVVYRGQSTILSSPSFKFKNDPIRLSHLDISSSGKVFNGGTITTEQAVKLDNLQAVAINILQPIYEKYGRSFINISSGIRNNAPNQSPTSMHPKGQAVDFQISGKYTDYAAHWTFIQELQTLLNYDQMILEYRDPKPNENFKRKVWIHIGYSGEKCRKQAFTMLNDRTYSQGFCLLLPK